MPVEVEQKFRVADRETLVRRLRERGAIRESLRRQADHYFAHPSRDFAREDEALRIREDSGSPALLCWKGPRAPGPVKIREEIEAALGPDGVEPMQAILRRLGFRPVATVRKQRETWALALPGPHPAGRLDQTRVQIALDTVEGLGEFAELELVVDADDRLAAAETVSQTATILGLVELERASYLNLLLRSGAAG